MGEFNKIFGSKFFSLRLLNQIKGKILVILKGTKIMNVKGIGNGMVCQNVNFGKKEKKNPESSEAQNGKISMHDQKLALALAAAALIGGASGCDTPAAAQQAKFTTPNSVAVSNNDEETLPILELPDDDWTPVENVYEIKDIKDAKPFTMNLGTCENEYVKITPNSNYRHSFTYTSKGYDYTGGILKNNYESAGIYKVVGNVDQNFPINIELRIDPRYFEGGRAYYNSKKNLYPQRVARAAEVGTDAILESNGAYYLGEAIIKHLNEDEQEELLKYLLPLLPLANKEGNANQQFLAGVFDYSNGQLSYKEIPEQFFNDYKGMDPEKRATLIERGYLPCKHGLVRNFDDKDFVTNIVKEAPATDKEIAQLSSIQEALNEFLPQKLTKDLKVVVYDGVYGHNYFVKENNTIYMSRETLATKGFASSFASALGLVSQSSFAEVVDKLFSDETALAKLRSLSEQYGDEVNPASSAALSKYVDSESRNIKAGMADLLISKRLKRTNYSRESLVDALATHNFQLFDNSVEYRINRIADDLVAKKIKTKEVARSWAEQDPEVSELRKFCEISRSGAEIVASKDTRIFQDKQKFNNELANDFWFTFTENFIKKSVFPTTDKYGIACNFDQVINDRDITPNILKLRLADDSFASVLDSTLKLISQKRYPYFPEGSKAAEDTLTLAHGKILSILISGNTKAYGNLVAYNNIYSGLQADNSVIQDAIAQKEAEEKAKEDAQKFEQEKKARKQNIISSIETN